jgi:hypothetical protein
MLLSRAAPVGAARFISAHLRSAALTIAFVAAGRGVAAQTPPAPPEPAPRVWNLSASFSQYFIPNDREYLQPTVTADREGLHLEARANYEGRGAGSAWLGWNLSIGTAVVLDVTPMIGGVFGDTHGVAAGARSALSWRGLEVASESEYVFDANGRADWFFYNWSQVTLSPVEWFYFGLVSQRTRVFASERDIQRGFLVGFSLPHVDITAHMFDPDDPNPTYVLNATVKLPLRKR